MERGKISPNVLRTLNKEPSSLFKRALPIAIILALSIWSISAIEFEGINDAGLKAVSNIIKYFFWPDANPDPEKHVLAKYLFSLEKFAVPYLMYETIMIAFVGTLIGAIISIPFAFLSSKNITGKFGSFVGSLIITLIRTVPIFIWGLIFIRIKGGAMAGVLAISSIGMISKLYVEVIEDIDTGVLEALDSIGATTLQKIRFGILPQLTASFLSTAIYRFEINVKNATILGMVGAGGIGFTLIDALGSFNFGVVAVCLWGIIPVVLLIEFFSTRLRAKLTGAES